MTSGGPLPATEYAILVPSAELQKRMRWRTAAS
jgi:hypothetical protein